MENTPTCPPCHGNCRQARDCPARAQSTTPAQAAARDAWIEKALTAAGRALQRFTTLAVFSIAAGLLLLSAGCGGGGDSEDDARAAIDPPDCGANADGCK